MSEPLEKYHAAVASFQREFILAMLAAHGGNRTRTARTLGLQRTYLLRLIRQFDVAREVPAPRRQCVEG